MPLPPQHSHTDAIFFFNDDEIIKDMLLVEFEAVLEGVVGVPEFSRKTYKAAFGIISNRLEIKAVVFFNVSFTKEGRVSRSWNMPLMRLAYEGVEGPDLGHGRIHLYSKKEGTGSQYAPFLWHPGSQLLEVLSKLNALVKTNKSNLYGRGQRSLGIAPGYADSYPGAPVFISESERNNIRADIERELKKEYQARIEKQDAHARNQRKRLESEKDELLNTVRSLQHQLELQALHNKEHVDVIARKYKDKAKGEMDGSRVRWQDLLDTKELELRYSRDNEEQLRQELEQLEDSLDEQSDEQVATCLNRLVDAGISLIVSRPGMGQCRLKVEELSEYLNDPAQFIAVRVSSVNRQNRAG